MEKVDLLKAVPSFETVYQNLFVSGLVSNCNNDLALANYDVELFFNPTSRNPK